jgi:hypothetical protein
MPTTIPALTEPAVQVRRIHCPLCDAPGLEVCEAGC